jgi:integrase
MIITEGAVTLRIYRVKAKTTKSGYAYIVRWNTTFGKEDKGFANLNAATEFAKEKAKHISLARSEGSSLTRDESQEYILAVKTLEELNIPLRSALEEYVKVKKMVGSSLLSLCDEWSAKKSGTITRITVPELVDKFIEAKNNAKKQGTYSYQSKLSKVAKNFKGRYIDQITTNEWTTFLNKIDNGVTRNDIRKRIVTLSRWAKKQSYLSADMLPSIENTDRAKEEPTNIGILTPDEFEKILKYLQSEHPEYLALAVLAGLCGLRTDEIHGKKGTIGKGQQWSDIHIKNKEKHLYVSAAKTNTPASRIINIRPNTVAWLKKCKNQEGPVCNYGAMQLLRKILIKNDFKIPENGLRHSWISYEFAKTRDKAKTAAEAGNSPQTIDKHYKVPLSRHRGNEWFNIKP